VNETYICAETNEELKVGTNAKLLSSKPIDRVAMLQVKSKFGDDLEAGCKWLSEIDDKNSNFRVIQGTDDYPATIFQDYVIWLNVSHKAIMAKYPRN